jgi:hypothetical protein
MMYLMTNTELTWTRPEMLSDADTWAAKDTAMALVADLGVTQTSARIAYECDKALAFLATAPNHVAERWMPAYQRVKSALGL